MRLRLAARLDGRFSLTEFTGSTMLLDSKSDGLLPIFLDSIRKKRLDQATRKTPSFDP